MTPEDEDFKPLLLSVAQSLDGHTLETMGWIGACLCAVASDLTGISREGSIGTVIGAYLAAPSCSYATKTIATAPDDSSAKPGGADNANPNTVGGEPPGNVEEQGGTNAGAATPIEAVGPGTGSEGVP